MKQNWLIAVVLLIGSGCTGPRNSDSQNIVPDRLSGISVVEAMKLSAQEQSRLVSVIGALRGPASDETGYVPFFQVEIDKEHCRIVFDKPFIYVTSSNKKLDHVNKESFEVYSISGQLILGQITLGGGSTISYEDDQFVLTDLSHVVPVANSCSPRQF